MPARQVAAPAGKSARAAKRAHYGTDRTPRLLEERTIHGATDRLLPLHVVVTQGVCISAHPFFSGRVSLFVGYVIYRTMGLEDARLELLRRWGDSPWPRRY